MSYHRACCCQKCPSQYLTLSLSAIVACHTCRTPIGTVQSIKVTGLDASGSFSAAYIGIDYTFDAAGEHQYSSTSSALSWMCDEYNNLGCSGSPASSHESFGWVQIWQDIATCEIVRCHALVTTYLLFPHLFGVLFASSQRHTIGTAIGNELDCATEPPYWNWGSGWPEMLVIANHGGGVVTR